MAFKSIFTVATQPDELTTTIPAAAKVAQYYDAHLDVLTLAVDRAHLAYSYITSGAALLQIAQEKAEADARELEATARKAISAEDAGLRHSVEAAVAFNGGLTDLVGQRARFADLAVLARPYGKGRAPEAEASLEAAIFEGGAAVLLVPDAGLAHFPPRHIVVAWNQSAEALRAIRAALPLLKQAARVTITVIDPPVQGPERSDPGGALCQMLVRHGVKAEVAVLARTLPRISDVLARQIRETGADLLVMGAYGHSRFREAILGGATRDLLEEAQIPVLLAH